MGLLALTFSTILFLSMILAFPVFWLWNDMLVRVFGVVGLDYWDAVYLIMLIRFLIPIPIPSTTNVGTKVERVIRA